MSEAKHTPGPWDYCKPHKRWMVYPESARNDGIDYFVAEAINVDGLEQEAKANARLIAAAPELLEALKVLLDEANGFNVSGVYFNEPCMGHKGLDLARAAIAKAEPRS